MNAIYDATASISNYSYDDYAPGYALRGSSYYYLGDYANALKDLTTALKTGWGDRAWYYRARSYVYDALGEDAKAAADREKADSIS